MPGLFDQETTVTRIEGADTAIGKVYRIVSRVTLDFTTVGAPNNTANTVFIATAIDTLGSGDVLEEITVADRSIPVPYTWPAIAGNGGGVDLDTIKVANDRDFRDGDVGNWVVANGGGSGTLTYSTDNVGLDDDKQILLTSDTDNALLAALNLPNVDFVNNVLYVISAKLVAPAANTNKNFVYSVGLAPFSADISSTQQGFSLIGDAVTTIARSFFVRGSDPLTGSFRIGFNGNPADGDKLYIDDVTIRPCQFSWIVYSKNRLLVENDSDFMQVDYRDNANGAYLLLSDASDLIRNLVPGAEYHLSFYASVGPDDTITAEVLSQASASLAETANIAEIRTLYEMTFIASHTTGDRLRFTGMATGDKVNIDSLFLYRAGAKGGMGMGFGMGMTLTL